MAVHVALNGDDRVLKAAGLLLVVRAEHGVVFGVLLESRSVDAPYVVRDVAVREKDILPADTAPGRKET